MPRKTPFGGVELPVIQYVNADMEWRSYGVICCKLKPEDIVEKTPLLFLACQLLLLDFSVFTQVHHHDLLKTQWEANTKSSMVEVRDDFNWVCIYRHSIAISFIFMFLTRH